MIRVFIRRYGWARLLRGYHLAATVFWMVMIPVSMLTGWWHSVAYVTVLSLWALVSTEASAYQASRAEVSVETSATTTSPDDHTTIEPTSEP